MRTEDDDAEPGATTPSRDGADRLPVGSRAADGPVLDEGIPAAVTGDESSISAPSRGTPAHDPGEGTPADVAGDGSPASANGDESTISAPSQGTPAHDPGDWSPASADGEGPDPAAAVRGAWAPSRPDDRTLRSEMWLVLWLSIAASGLSSLLSLLDSLTSGQSLASQSTTLVTTYIPDRPWLDVLYQVARISIRLVPVLLVIHLLRRSGEGRQAIGLDLRHWRRDLATGAVLAAVLGGLGLGFYLLAYHLGMNVRIAAVTTTREWWTPLLLVASAAYNAILEEVIVLAYLLHRTNQLGWRPWAQVGTSALLRGAYHLYQGFGGFLGNVAMGTVFALLYRRWGRVMPFLYAHLFIDATAFLGYYWLGGHVSWLP